MSTFDAIREMIVDQFELEPTQITPDATLESLKIDSLAAVEFMFLLEETFKLRMPEVPNGVLTVGDIATGVDAARDQSGTAPPA